LCTVKHASLSQGLGGGKSDAFQAGLYVATKSGPAYLTADFNAQSYAGARRRLLL
jgi:hypothetical protein